MPTPYKPLKIAGTASGLIQERQEFILPEDANPVLQDCYIWREQIKRKLGFEFIGRFQRQFSNISIGNSGASPWSFNLFTLAHTYGSVNYSASETSKSLVLGSVTITIGAIVFTDNGDGTLSSSTGGNSGTINYVTGAVDLKTTASPGTATTASFFYNPNLPVMGLPILETSNVDYQNTIGFDTVYAYIFGSNGWQEWIPGTTWNGSDSNFFWTTNFWYTDTVAKLFWATNFNIVTPDPIRYTDGSTWTDFTPTLDAAGNTMTTCLILIAYRGYFVAFNTFEGKSGTNYQYPQRIRWSQPLGNSGPPDTNSPTDQTNGWNVNATLPAKNFGGAGFLDISTGESIVAVGYVRDNLVIYCDRSTWQLRFRNTTSPNSLPFQAEKINTEFGATSTFSAVKFDLALVGIGNRGIVTCDGFKSELIDIKIPDLVYKINQVNAGMQRIYGVRNFENRLAYWTFVYNLNTEYSLRYPNQRLVYNYENDSWALFNDSITCFGLYQPLSGRTWLNAKTTWQKANFPWINIEEQTLAIIGGNQQGYTFYLDSLNGQDKTLFISAITGYGTSQPTIITSPNHNLQTGQCISIDGIPEDNDFANLNKFQAGEITGATQAKPCVITSANHGLSTGNEIEINDVEGMTELNGIIYIVTVLTSNTFSLAYASSGMVVDSTDFDAYTSDGEWTSETINAYFVVTGDATGANQASNFSLWKYSPVSGSYTIPQEDASTKVYLGGGEISVRDGFTIQSKKFNFMDEGQSIQLGYIDVLAQATDSGAISLAVYNNYDPTFQDHFFPSPAYAVNIGLNLNPYTNLPDPFFNAVLPTFVDPNPSVPISGSPTTDTGTKYWHRIYCAARANFITIQWFLSMAQLIGYEQEQEVQIDAMVLWRRPAGRMTNY